MPLPPGLTEEDRHRVRQFYRVLLSYADFKHANATAEHILDTGLHALYPGEATVLLQALNCSMVIAYARPFSGNSGRRGESIPDLPGRFLKVLSPDELAVHEVVMFDRNKYLAHTDADASGLDPVRLQLDDEKQILIPLVEDRLAPLDEDATELVRSATYKLLQQLVAERQAMEP